MRSPSRKGKQSQWDSNPARSSQSPTQPLFQQLSLDAEMMLVYLCELMFNYATSLLTFFVKVYGACLDFNRTSKMDSEQQTKPVVATNWLNGVSDLKPVS